MTSTSRSGWLRLTFPQLWVALAILLPVLASLLATMSAVDLAYHVRAGELILDQGALLRSDPFAFTTGGGAWLDQQWGSQVLLALGYRLVGWAGLAVLRALLVALAIGLVFVACRRSGVGLRVAAWLALGAFVLSAAALGLRPQLLGMVLFAATLAILAGREHRTGRAAWLVWLIPILVIPWASIHGSFIFAPVAVGVAWLEDELAARPGARRLLVVAIATVARLAGQSVRDRGLVVCHRPDDEPHDPEADHRVAADHAPVGGRRPAVRLDARVRDPDRASGPRRRLRHCLGPRSCAEFGPTLLWLLFLGVVGAIAERGIAWWALAAPVAIAGVLGRPLPASHPRPMRPAPSESSARRSSTARSSSSLPWSASCSCRSGAAGPPSRVRPAC